MQLTIDISEKDLVEFGMESIQREIDSTMKWMRIRQKFGKISEELRSSFDEEDYYRKVKEVREFAWDDYKKSLSL